MQKAQSRHILLVAKAGQHEAASLCTKVRQWLEQRGHSVTVIEAGRDDPSYALPLDHVVVFGGDGTMLGVCRRIAGSPASVLGINFGRVGFLTEARPDEWQEYLTACLENRLPRRSCAALVWSILREGEILSGGYAVNDVVLGRATLARLLSLDISINGQRFGHLRSDGLILSTPLGSSGYCASAGGPLLCPGVQAVAFVPVCPFRKGAQPMVFPGEAVFHLRIEPGSKDCYITLDGQEGQKLQVGDLVEVRCLPNAVQLLDDESHFFARLRKRGFTPERCN